MESSNRAPRPHPACPICALIEAAQGQPGAIAMGYIKQAEQVQCRCPDRNHTVLGAHPHTQQGCQGFAVETDATREQMMPAPEAR
jgi:hypothetical protein